METKSITIAINKLIKPLLFFFINVVFFICKCITVPKVEAEFKSLIMHSQGSEPAVSAVRLCAVYDNTITYW